MARFRSRNASLATAALTGVLLTGALLIAPYDARAQGNGAVAGTVVVSGSLRPLPGVQALGEIAATMWATPIISP